jgi:hypothetical protein
VLLLLLRRRRRHLVVVVLLLRRRLLGLRLVSVVGHGLRRGVRGARWAGACAGRKRVDRW